MKTGVKGAMIIWAVLAMAQTALAGQASDSEVLLRSYIRFSLAQEVQAQARALGKNLSRPDADQIQEIADKWFAGETVALRKNLENKFGDTARERFKKFVGEYTTAEHAGDLEYLGRLSTQAGLKEPPPDYAALRKLALKRWLNKQLSAGTKLLSEMQTWAEVRSKKNDAPPLSVWLARDEQPTASPEPSSPTNSLAAAEAPTPKWDANQQPSGSAMDAFSQLRREKREQAMQNSQAGMQQMAMERQSAEQEYGARKMAAAQADADAMRTQAQKLAAVEGEALAQRENSWGNRIKRIIGGTLSVGLGAFTGGIGVKAGQQAADELFR